MFVLYRASESLFAQTDRSEVQHSSGKLQIRYGTFKIKSIKSASNTMLIIFTNFCYKMLM